jgi:hypothetical protein
MVLPYWNVRIIFLQMIFHNPEVHIGIPTFLTLLNNVKKDWHIFSNV